MRIGSPSSRGYFTLRLSFFDAIWAVVCAPLALYLTAAQVLGDVTIAPLALYCSITLVCCLLSFVAFRIRDGLTQYFTVNDALNCGPVSEN